MADYTMEEIKQIIRSIAISGSSYGLSVKMLADDFKKMEGFDLPYQRLGFRAPDEFLRSLNDTVTVTGYGTSALVEPVVTQSTRHVRDLVRKSNSKTSGKKFFNKSGSNSVYRSPPEYKSDYGRSSNQQQYHNRSGTSNGFWKPTAAYIRQTNNDHYDEQRCDPRKVTNQEFDFRDTNGNDFGSSDEEMPKFVLTEDKKLSQLQSTLQEMTITATPTKPSKVRSNDAIPDDAVLALINSLEIPDGAMNLTDSIETQKIPAGIVPKQSVQIFVTEVHNPNRLWYHMGENANKIDELMNEIDAHYTHMERDEWRLKPSNVAVGLYCVAKFAGMWHRGKIVSDLAHNKVRVFYIDYGTVSEQELKDIKFMAKCFASMPAQSMRASLAYVKPVGHRWTRDSCWSLLSLVYEKILYAYVVDINREENFMDVVLIDTTGNKDSIINQQLFIKGHAIWEDDVPYKEKSTENFRERTKSYSEIFPRFDDLENGIYPTLLEIADDYSSGFNFQRYFMQSLQDDCEFLQHIFASPFTVDHCLLMDKDSMREANHSYDDPLLCDFEDVYDFYEEPYLEYVHDAGEEFGNDLTQAAPEVDQIVEVKPTKPKKQVRFKDPEKQIIPYDATSPIVENGPNQNNANTVLDESVPQLREPSRMV
ncbi:uncharacterized protein LOC134211930 isoform X1 [Armigeres subalbatus]|uniref:uncharacterized protein LOC134211930 isoform X1 n=2 Tax=Armigeres subalbatus TaxID=124917 RepID=UPI002ED1BC9B